MIRCNLAILLAERGLKITKVSNDTGISRTTLTSLSNNYSQGIQLETLNTLCMYLKIKPEQLLSFVPLNLKIQHVSNLNRYEDFQQFEIEFEIEYNGRKHNCGLCATVEFFNFNSEVNIDIGLFDEDDETNEENAIIKNTISKLPQPFLIDFQNDLIKQILFELDKDTDYKVTLVWSI